eukprot:CFRG7169T1
MGRHPQSLSYIIVFGTLYIIFQFFGLINSEQHDSSDIHIERSYDISVFDDLRHFRGATSNEEFVHFIIGTQFFKDIDPRESSTGAAHAYRAKCELLARITLPSVILAAREMYATEAYANVQLHWVFDSAFMIYDSTCRAALEIANNTLGGIVKLEIDGKRELDVGKNSVMLMSRLDFDDAISKHTLKYIVDAVLSSVKETGFWYVVLPGAVYWRLDGDGPCGDFIPCSCLHNGLMKTHAIYGPKMDACKHEKDYTQCITNNNLGLYTFQHTRLDEHTVRYVSKHFEACKSFHQCMSYVCRDGKQIPITPQGDMIISSKSCKNSSFPLALYTMSGMQDSGRKKVRKEFPAHGALSGTAVCAVLKEAYGIEFPIIHVEAPLYSDCLRFARAPKCLRAELDDGRQAEDDMNISTDDSEGR